MNLKVKDNLFILENRVVSYETHVATIKGNEIVANGKYSRTTSKQLAYLSRITGLRLIENQAKQRYDKFFIGVRCTPPSKIDISTAAAVRILRKLKNTDGDILNAAALAYGELRTIDAAFVKIALWKKGWTNEEIDACKALALLGIE